ncbi:MAG TPA: hypothetical protein VJR04_02245 [Terriglobales bacterium]|nr:hypothetical protein [Terriglobales bacterium]
MRFPPFGVMSVEKATRLHSKLEELRIERQRLAEEIRERQRAIEEIDGVIRRFLQLKVDSIAEQRAKHTPKRK